MSVVLSSSLAVLLDSVLSASAVMEVSVTELYPMTASATPSATSPAWVFLRVRLVRPMAMPVRMKGIQDNAG